MAFVRVKRRLDEEPVEALLLAFKKRKISSCVTPSGVVSQKVENVLQFCGTLENKEEDVFEIARNYRESCQRAKKDIKSRNPLAEVAKQVKAERKEAIKMGRYKLVCHQRDMPIAEESDQAKPSLSTAQNAAIARHPSQSKLQIYDLVNDSEEVLEPVKEETIALNGVPLVKEPNPQQFDYVYDLYYSEAWNVDDGLIDNILSVQPYTQELYYGDYREDDEIADDDEDSNDENCYKNDYPSDEEYYRDDDGDDYGLEAAIKPWNLDDSEEDDDGLVYTRKASPVYGSYEAYKRRLKREEEGESEESDYD